MRQREREREREEPIVTFSRMRNESNRNILDFFTVSPEDPKETFEMVLFLEWF
jgi:hypothetical protein